MLLYQSFVGDVCIFHAIETEEFTHFTQFFLFLLRIEAGYPEDHFGVAAFNVHFELGPHVRASMSSLMRRGRMSCVARLSES